LTSDLVDDVKRLLNLGIGDRGRLEHIKQTIEENKVLYTSDNEYLKKLIQNFLVDQTEKIESIPIDITKNPIEKPPKEIVPTKDTSEIFCRLCGAGLPSHSNFCSKCGNGVKPSPTLPKQEVQISKTQSWGYKFSIIMGIISILGGFGISNGFNVFVGIILVIIGFVSLKNKSKSIDQFLSLVSFILLAIVIINWINVS